MRSRPDEGRGHAFQLDRPLRADPGCPPASALRDAGGRRAGAAVRRLDAVPRLRRAVAGDGGRFGAVVAAPPPAPGSRTCSFSNWSGRRGWRSSSWCRAWWPDRSPRRIGVGRCSTCWAAPCRAARSCSGSWLRGWCMSAWPWRSGFRSSCRWRLFGALDLAVVARAYAMLIALAALRRLTRDAGLGRRPPAAGGDPVVVHRRRRLAPAAGLVRPAGGTARVAVSVAPRGRRGDPPEPPARGRPVPVAGRVLWAARPDQTSDGPGRGSRGLCRVPSDSNWPAR